VAKFITLQGELITLIKTSKKKMKSVVKFAKSLRVDSQTLNAMFVGYFVLLIVMGSFVVSKVNDASGCDSAVTASSEVKVERAQTAN
jgi:hypothetical protein